MPCAADPQSVGCSLTAAACAVFEAFYESAGIDAGWGRG